MDTISAVAESVTLSLAGDAALHLFTTGQGNVIGDPTIPAINLSANPNTVHVMSGHGDVDVSAIISLEQTLDEAAVAVTDSIIRRDKVA